MFEGVMTWEAGKTSRSWTWMAGMSIQASLIGLAILIPLLRPDALPRARWQPSWFMPLVPVGPPRGPAPAPKLPGRTRAVVPFDPAKLVAPSTVPDRVARVIDQVGGPPAINGDGPAGIGVPGGTGPGVVGGSEDGSRAVLPPPPLERTEPVKRDAATAEVQRIRLGGVVLEGKLVRKVMPVYPALARAARISGVVRLVGIVGTDGNIRKLDVVSGHALLVGAAVDAVRQWGYRPTMLNGAPAEVVAPIDVTFRLGQ